MNELASSLGLAHWKPVLTAALMPPLPLLVLVLMGARLLLWRRTLGWLVLLSSATALWLSTTVAVGEWIVRAVLQPPPALNAAHPADTLRRALRRQSAAIVVLGGGRETRAPEYGGPNLSATSLERLRYGLWLSRELRAPALYTGGVGYADDGGPAEAEVAARIAENEFGRPLRWVEGHSRDTRENAALTLATLRGQGIDHLVVVTQAWHMPRAQRAFQEAAQREGIALNITPAPVGLAPRITRPSLRWLPSAEGTMLVRQSLREAAGLLAGA